ncbi:restriction endonuclease subunit S [Mesomycoplasma ovipneumoniae]|uniref:restriction endonuclease subunit S n=1 Tax=Mesomycoplasma ovipneumoniae TaxID=29562 RepID=UPI0029645481|nr:restriction endonuclease subunit S [Mesomycoplasma ovipneumoniae]MDW2913484.1 restriction endonuclease subunit S [Mesomycoplasma ovipneumoniae]
MSKNSNISKIRIEGFNQPWFKKRLGDALKHEQSWKYIESSTKYFNHGIPVLTPGKSFVLGYAKDTKNIKKASENSPIILFDDFTTQSRLINFDFKVRSSALKLLINKNPKDNLHFHYLILQKIKYNVRHHGRHWLPLFVNFTFFQPIWPEQQKISRLFETLENLVNKVEEKMSILKNLKKGFTNKMFANFSSDFPSIRFKNFNTVWISDQVKNLFEISRGQFLTKNQIKTKPVERERERERGYIYPVYSSQTENQGILGYYNEFLAENVITYTADGNAGIVNFRKGKFFATSHCGILTSKKYPENEFFAIGIGLQTKKWVSKSIVPSLKTDNMAQIELKFTPDISEQQKISQLFETFDSLILAYEQKIAYFQKIKKTLLNEMFI